MKYRSTKTYGHDIGLSCAFRQWRATSHCRFLHGYALSVKLDFECEQLDDCNWVVDFGGLKTFKDWLQKTFDHKTLVARDDPLLFEFRELERSGGVQLVEVEKVGCEAFAAMIFEEGLSWLEQNEYVPRVKLLRVEVREHGANSAIATC